MGEENNQELTQEKVESIIKEIKNYISNFFKVKEVYNYFAQDLHTRSYNRMKDSKRIELFATLHNVYTTYLAGRGINVFNEKLIMIDDDSVPVLFISDEGNVFLSKKIVKQSNLGIAILKEYIAKTYEFAILQALSLFNEIEVDFDTMDEEVRSYYENVLGSMYSGGWSNFLTEGDINYYRQPITREVYRLAREITREYIKKLIKEGKEITVDMSELIHEDGNELYNKEKYDLITEKIIKKNRERVQLFDEENRTMDNYVKLIDNDMSVLSDDEFYSIFNYKYSYQILFNEDDNRLFRVNSIIDELARRVMQDYGIENEDIIRFSVNYVDEDEGKTQDYEFKPVNVIACNENGYRREFKANELHELIKSIFVDISKVIAEKDKYDLKEEEEADYKLFYMFNRYVENGYGNEKDIIFVNHYFNPIELKREELLKEVDEKVKKAIEKSDLANGNSIIPYVSVDDLNGILEFNAGKSKEEIYNDIKKYVLKRVEEFNGLEEKNNAKKIR